MEQELLAGSRKPLVELEKKPRTKCCHLSTKIKQRKTNELRNLVLSIKACNKTQTATLSNLEYCAQRTRQRIAECDRMLQRKKAKDRYGKKSKSLRNKNDHYNKKPISLELKRSRFSTFVNRFQASRRSYVHRELLRKNKTAQTLFKENTLSNEADGKLAEEAVNNKSARAFPTETHL